MKNGSNINNGNNKLKEADYVYYNFFFFEGNVVDEIID